jgi:8-oxo-dGTP pyrophosphatase MutT (NUDIX family)
MLAAVRETAEEVGILIARPSGSAVEIHSGDDPYLRLDQAGSEFDLSRLVYLSNWVTPRFVARRFDTRFFLTVLTEPAEPQALTGEFVSTEWVDVRRALERHDAGEMPMIFPTLSHLRYISGFRSAAELEAEARSLDRIPQIEPRRFERGDHVELTVSGDSRFER